MKTEILKAALFTPLDKGRWGIPLLCWGEPGVAKTSVIEAVCNRFGMPCETLSPGERGEGVFGVVPVPDGKGADMILHYPRPDWTARFDRDGRGVVFIDEATSTPPALQAPIMGLILARRVGGYVLQPGVRVLAAANPVEIAAGGFDLSAPVANRFGHIEWGKPSIEEHVQFMMRGSSKQTSLSTDTDDEDMPTTASDEEARVLKAWPEAWARAVGLEVAYLQRNPGKKNMCPPVGDPKASRGWPSDRSWENATRAYASAMVHGLSATDTEIFVAAFISEAVASEMFAFITAQDLPDPAELLDGKVDFKHNAKRLDRTVAVLSACVALVAPKQAAKRSERAESLWKLMGTMCEKADNDVLVPPIYAMIESELHANKAASPVLAKINPILKAAGITPGKRKF